MWVQKKGRGGEIEGRDETGEAGRRGEMKNNEKKRITQQHLS